LREIGKENEEERKKANEPPKFIITAWSFATPATT
jgi:hypothetical protein